MIFDSSFWVAISFVIFLLIVYKPIKFFITKALDNRIKTIKQELEGADAIHKEAVKLLEKYKNQKLLLEKEAKEISKNTEIQIKNMEQNAKQEIKEYFDKKYKQTLDRIAAQEEELKQKLQLETVDIIFDVASKIISKKIDKQTSKEILEESLDIIMKKVH